MASSRSDVAPRVRFLTANESKNGIVRSFVSPVGNKKANAASGLDDHLALAYFVLLGCFFFLHASSSRQLSRQPFGAVRPPWLPAMITIYISIEIRLASFNRDGHPSFTNVKPIPSADGFTHETVQGKGRWVVQRK